MKLSLYAVFIHLVFSAEHPIRECLTLRCSTLFAASLPKLLIWPHATVSMVDSGAHKRGTILSWNISWHAASVALIQSVVLGRIRAIDPTASLSFCKICQFYPLLNHIASLIRILVNCIKFLFRTRIILCCHQLAVRRVERTFFPLNFTQTLPNRWNSISYRKSIKLSSFEHWRVFFLAVLGNKKIKKPSRKSKSKKQKFDEDEDRKIVEPTSTQDAELEKLIINLTKLHDQEKPALFPDGGNQDVKPTASNLLDIVGKQLVAAIDWAKGLPGYETLTLNDQAILLQAGWIEMLLLNWTFYSLSHSKKTQFAANFVVCESMAVEFGLETVHHQLSSLVSRVQGYGIDEEEFVCLKAIGLLNAGKSTSLVFLYFYGPSWSYSNPGLRFIFKKLHNCRVSEVSSHIQSKHWKDLFRGALSWCVALGGKFLSSLHLSLSLMTSTYLMLGGTDRGYLETGTSLESKAGSSPQETCGPNITSTAPYSPQVLKKMKSRQRKVLSEVIRHFPRSVFQSPCRLPKSFVTGLSKEDFQRAICHSPFLTNAVFSQP